MSPFDLESRTVYVNGCRINVRTAGAGPMVLLCHGFPETWHSWRHQVAPLTAAGYRVVIMDMRGYGRSHKPVDFASYRITELVRDCAGVVEGLGESKAVVVGHDWGAAVAWTAAWLRPTMFQAVAALSVPFGARGLHALPGDPFGAIRPTVAHRALGGDELFYQEHHCLPGSEADGERNIREWLKGRVFSGSAQGALPTGFEDTDLLTMSADRVLEYVRAKLCIPRGEGFLERLPRPERLPDWLTQDDFDLWVGELEHGGLIGPMNYYRAQDLNWELLGRYEGRSLTVPSLFIGGNRDTATIWGQEAIKRAEEVLTDLRGVVIVPECGHYIQQEAPGTVNQELLAFLEEIQWQAT